MKLLRILYLGDIMGRPGREMVTRNLANLRKKLRVDLVIAQAENVSHGKSMTPAHMRELQQAGVDAFTGGNHTIERPALTHLLADPNEPVIAPLNQHGVGLTWGAKSVQTVAGKVLVVSLLGTTFPLRTELRTNPLHAIDELLEQVKHQTYIAKIINFHGDFSSEKRVIGYYLDGRVSAVIGDHWHVATADAMVLPGGTAHITDVGMCGTVHSSLGVKKEIIISRWRDEAILRNEIAEEGPRQLNGVLVTINPQTGLAKNIRQIYMLQPEV